MTVAEYTRPADVKIELREAWLARAADLIWPMITEAGGTRPEKCRVSCGWPSKSPFRRASSKSRRIGEAWHDGSEDGAREVFISPALADEVEVMDVLAHELIHAALPGGAGHGPAFQRVMKKIGLRGKPTATVAGDELVEKLRGFAHELGRYPHAKLDRTLVARQRARLMKGECPDCGYVIRVTRTWINVGMPTCPCGSAMESVEYEPEGEPLALDQAHLVFVTGDGRFRLSTTKTGNSAGRWLVQENWRPAEDDPYCETVASDRWTYRANREDALAFIAAVRAGETDFPEYAVGDQPDTWGDDDEDLGELGSWDATDVDHFLGDDEDEHPDYEDGRLADDEEGDYERLAAIREGSGRVTTTAGV